MRPGTVPFSAERELILGARGAAWPFFTGAAPASVWPSAYSYSLGTPDHPQLWPRGMYYAAQYPACAYPCQRFAHTLANVHA